MDEKMTTEKPTTLLAAKAPHHLAIENRHLLSATGIVSIISYDEFAATLETNFGTLVVGGKDIHVSELSVETGEVKVQGEIEYVQYAAKKEKAEPFFKRLVK